MADHHNSSSLFLCWKCYTSVAKQASKFLSQFLKHIFSLCARRRARSHTDTHISSQRCLLQMCHSVLFERLGLHSGQECFITAAHVQGREKKLSVRMTNTRLSSIKSVVVRIFFSSSLCMTCPQTPYAVFLPLCDPESVSGRVYDIHKKICQFCWLHVLRCQWCITDFLHSKSLNIYYLRTASSSTL